MRVIGVSLIAAINLISLVQLSSGEDVVTVGRAVPDEYYLGEPGLGYEPFTDQPFEVGPNGEQPKLNQDYVWGMAANNRYIWIGTGAGSAAAAQSQAALGGDPVEPNEVTSQMGTQIRVTEFGVSQYPYLAPGLAPYFGDWRPPRIYQYDAKQGQLFDRTPRDYRLNLTLGLRSCGVHNGVALLGGPTLGQVGICLFAFDADSGKFLGSTLETRYSNIRRWIVADGQLYTSVLNTVQGRVRGSVLKWTGSKAAPFRFDVVGHLDNEGGYLAVHEGRLYVGTWPSYSLLSALPDITMDTTPPLPPVAGLWMSPPLPTGGLRLIHQEMWTKVWTPETYDPDPVLARGYAMGAMESYQGKLYFATLHFSGTGRKVFESYYGGRPSSQSRRADRDIIVLRCDGFADPENINLELLYGNSQEYVYVPTDDPPVIDEEGEVVGSWVLMPTLTGPGIYGPASFGDDDNRYAWSSVVHEGKLYFGTYDQEGLFEVDDIINEIELAELEMREPDFSTGGDADVGADLYRFDGHTGPATAVTINAFEKYSIHGFRNMVSTPYGMFLGTANSQNLLFDPTDNLPDGGWELLKLVSSTPMESSPAQDVAAPSQRLQVDVLSK